LSSEPLVFAEPEPERCQPVTLVGGLDHTVRYRLRPDPDQPGQLAAVAAATEARDRAMDRLSEHFGGFRIDLVQQNVDANVASVLQVDPDWLRSLDGPGMVDRVLTWHDLPTPRLTFAGGGRVGHEGPPQGTVESSANPAAITRVRPASLADRLRGGRTAIVNQIDQYDAALGELCEDLERAYGTRVAVNCYVSYGTAEGFGAHWDDHDVIVLQLLGSKYWELRGPDVLSPATGYTPPGTRGESVWSGVLRPGAALYIPRGWGHRVSGFDELSLHLTIGMRRLCGRDVLDFVATEALKEPAFRADVPTGGGGFALDEALAALAGDEAVDAATGFWRAQLTARPRDGFLATAHAVHAADLDDTWIRAALPGGIVFADRSVDRDDGRFGLAAHAVQVRLADDAAAPLAQLADAEPHRVGDLTYPCGHPGTACRDRFVRGLLEAGIVHVVDHG
jgi:hypothetical protein